MNLNRGGCIKLNYVTVGITRNITRHAEVNMIMMMMILMILMMIMMMMMMVVVEQY